MHWKQERINIFLSAYEKTEGRRYKLSYGAMMGMISKWAESIPCDDNNFYGIAYTDDDTGEIKFEIPPIEDWTEEVQAFMVDSFARTKQALHFGYFLKRYGSFAKLEESKVNKQKEEEKLYYICPACSQNVKRSAQTGHRYSCVNAEYWYKLDEANQQTFKQ